jgi:energy-coupling factor transporter ATP-binding protein EcfA2
MIPRMQLTRVELRNYRCFGDAQLDLTAGGEPLRTVLLVGGNGSGKSSILQAIAGVLTVANGRYGGDRPTVDDIRDGERRADLDVAWRDDVDGQRQIFSFPLSLLAERIELTPSAFVGPGVTVNFAARNAPDGVVRLTSWQGSLAANGTSGVAVAFDVYRLLPPMAITGPQLGPSPSTATKRRSRRRSPAGARSRRASRSSSSGS